MTITYHSQNRKELVKAISEIIGIPAVYQFMPTCAYKIGECYTVTKSGDLEISDQADHKETERLLAELENQGYVVPDTTEPESKVLPAHKGRRDAEGRWLPRNNSGHSAGRKPLPASAHTHDTQSRNVRSDGARTTRSPLSAKRCPAYRPPPQCSSARNDPRLSNTSAKPAAHEGTPPGSTTPELPQDFLSDSFSSP